MLVELTENGAHLTAEILEKIAKNKSDFFRVLSKKEKKELAKILKKLIYSL